MTAGNGRDPAKRHSRRPYRDSALVYGFFALVVIVVAVLTGGRVLWAIVLKEGSKLIGATLLEKIDWRNRDAESGIVIGDKSEWRRGHASEAMRLRTEYAFMELGLRKVWTGVWLPNAGSRRALEKAGYRQCGLMRRHVFVDGQWHDVWLAEVLREDWERESSCSAP